MPSDLVALVADLIPKPAVSPHVADWPEDERDYYRNGDWRSFTERADALTRMRQEKAARAILAAILGSLAEADAPAADEPAEQCMPRVGGKPFRCQCGANVFTRRGDLFTCNACRTEYTSA